MELLLPTSGKNFLITMFELQEIVRQRESKQFAEILNRLREDNHIADEIPKLKERCISENL